LLIGHFANVTVTKRTRFSGSFIPFFSFFYIHLKKEKDINVKIALTFTPGKFLLFRGEQILATTSVLSQHASLYPLGSPSNVSAYGLKSVFASVNGNNNLVYCVTSPPLMLKKKGSWLE